MADLLLAVDVGGTFTDAYLHDPDGSPTRAKAPTTPEDRTEGVVEAARRVLAEADSQPEDVERVLHGTTTATNALLEGEGARTALVTNDGFEDVLEIGRQQRASLYDLDAVGPEPIVPRGLRFGLTARLGPAGEQLSPVDEGELAAVGEELASRDVEAVAVGMLHAHKSPAHERGVAEHLREQLDGVPVVTSAETSPEPREVERLSTTVVNATLMPLVGDYLARIEESLAQAGIQAPIRVLDSAGATVAPLEMANRPVTAVLSGPAGGAAANRHLANSLAEPTLVGVDMGGTSTDVSLVTGGEPTTRWQLEIAGRPLQIPAVDVHTIGAGGGSIAWRDEAGGLQIGPESAGARPGPACYDRGGDRPTLTDANLVLDRIPPSAALAGELTLDEERAREAIATLGEAPVRELARQILEIAVARTTRGLRAMLARHAVDPETLTLAAFGGAGPQLGAAWARRLGIPRFLVPPAAGVTSAQGLLAAPPRVERSQGLLVPASELSDKRFEEVTRRLRETASQRMTDGGPTEAWTSASARYAGQGHELTVSVPGEDPARIPAAFEARHEEVHGYTLEEPVEVVALRVRVQGEPALRPSEDEPGDPIPLPEPIETVETFFVGHEQARPTPVYAADALGPGTRLQGPAILSSKDTTALVPPGAVARVRPSGVLVVHREGSP